MNWSYSEDEVRKWYAGKFAEWDWGLVAETAEAGVITFVATSGTHPTSCLSIRTISGVALARRCWMPPCE